MSTHQSSPQESSLTFAPEIETATVSMLWHHPDWMAAFLREHDPSFLFFQPHLRHIVEAINLAVTELGFATWPTVVQIVRELGAYIQLGGLEGLNQVYSAVEPTKIDGLIFEHYCEMLKRYALAREHSSPVYRFVRGDFMLVPNRLKRSDSAPDFLGTGKFIGRNCRVMGFHHSQGIRLAILPQ